MGKALGITRTDHTAAALRALAGKCRDGAQVRRLLALAMVLDGHPRSIAASSNGMDRQTLRDWVHRYNAEGVGGPEVASRARAGRRALTEEQMAELLRAGDPGPRPELHKVVRWRCVDLKAEVTRRFGVEVHENTIGRWLHELGLTRLQPRPVHPKRTPRPRRLLKKLRRPGRSRASRRNRGRDAR